MVETRTGLSRAALSSKVKDVKNGQFKAKYAVGDFATGGNPTAASTIGSRAAAATGRRSPGSPPVIKSAAS